MVRDRSSNRKGRGDHGRSKFKQDFKDLKKNHCTLCKEIGHWKIDCPKAKGKKKESKTEANLALVVNTQASTSQADGSDSDPSVFSFSVTTPTVDYSDKSKWILYTGVTYHVCPNKDWFSNFKKLDGCYTVISDDLSLIHI